VLLSGCGAYDGTDVSEAVLVLLALDRAGARAELFAPEREQMDVVDHASTLTAEPGEGARRDVFRESCRLSRARVTPLGSARVEILDALVLPGGFGAAKNWMTGFASPGVPRTPHAEEARFVRHFLDSRKAVGSISLGRALVSAVIGEELPDEPAPVPATGVAADEARRLYYTPGFLASDRISEVAAGIERLVEKLLGTGVATGASR
jgi:enhancing lycopene biosynthesis protein 2